MATINVGAGQTSSGNKIISGGTINVLSGGTAITTTVSSGGLENVSSGGTSIGAIIISGDLTLNETSFPNVSVISGGGLVVGPGGVAMSATLTGDGGNAGNAIAFVSSGGELISATVTNGREEVALGGVTSATILNSGSILGLLGTSVDTVVNSGGQENVNGGGVASGTLVNSGGTQNIVGGATAVDTKVTSGGTEVVGGVASNSMVSSGGTEVVVGGVASNSVVSSGGLEYVSSGGTSIGAIIISGDLTLNEDSFPNVSVISGGGLVVGPGGVAMSATLTGDGSTPTNAIAFVSSGGELISATVTNGREEVALGGVTSATILNSGSILGLLGTSVDTVVNSGGAENVNGGGVASGTLVNAGGTQFIVSGAAAIDTKVTSGGTEVVLGVASNSVVSSGGLENVSSGGTSIGAIIISGDLTLNEDSFPNVSVISGGGLVVGPGGVAMSATLTGDGSTPTNAIAFVSSGGELISATVTNGREEVALGGVTSATILNSGSILGLLGTSVDTVVNSGGAENVNGGGVASGTLVNAGGTQFIVSGAAAIDTKVTSGGTEVVQGGVASSTVVSSGGTLLDLGFTNNSVINGGIEIVSSGGSLMGTTTVSGGTAVLNGTAGTGIIAFAGSGGDVQVNGMSMPTNVISGFGAGDVIDLASIASGSITSVSEVGDTVTIFAGGSSFVLDVAGAAADGYKLVDDGHGGTFFEVCFAEGTHIATPDGETVVEKLATGDLVTTLKGAKPVTWVGHRSVDVSTLKDPESGRLVRIRTGAFGEAIPHRDLLVTQEHCVFVDGGLIPARMLVNNRSIIIDRSINAYSYYHVELEEHGILVAEGLTTESYLDTGNRPNFANYAAPALRPSFALDAQHKNWATHAAAPLTVERATVEPVWRMLEERARQMNVALVTAPSVLTEDPGLHLGTDTGMTIRPVRNTGGRYVFSVPAGATGLRLLSRTARPSETVGPFVDDRRALGVLVGEVVVWHGRKRIAMDQHLAISGLDGWFDFETGAQRWTAGDAELPVALDNKPSLVEIEVIGAGPYLAETADHVARLGKIA